MEYNMDCAICMNKIRNKCTLKCNHNLCFTCIDKWHDSKQTCPICRSKFSINDYKKIRQTRSMSKNSRIKLVTNDLYTLVRDANRTSIHLLALKKYKICKVLKKIYDNRWILECEYPNDYCERNCYGCIAKNLIKQKLEQFIDDEWVEGAVWMFKFRDYLS